MENYLLNYDPSTGNILGFYLKSIHENIPEPYIEITPEKHDFYMRNNGLYRLNPQTLEDELVPIASPAPQPPNTEDRLNAIEAAISALMGV